ncbi:hypothetical protein [Paenibacillus sp. Soil766]|uniref:hypothetical protein n=1 Tax=Paenibacillus sp. Soil766 TaxID=1736404 RepID=UPI001F37FA01|nr:hypothetical protein [Paenibacillus sp. Soil766]
MQISGELASQNQQTPPTTPERRALEYAWENCVGAMYPKYYKGIRGYEYNIATSSP